MYFCNRRNKPILDRQFPIVYEAFRKDMKYQRVLEKCKVITLADVEDEEEYDYYVATGKGIPIYTDEMIKFDDEDGIEQEVPWTLETYVNLSPIKYFSKARLYCVRKLKCSVEDPPAEEVQESTNDIISSGSPSQEVSVTEEIVYASANEQVVEADVKTEEPPPTYEALFCCFNESRYENKFVASPDLFQMAALEQNFGRDENEEEFSATFKYLHPNNPCHVDIPFVGVRNVITREKVIHLTETYNMDNGHVVYKMPMAGSDLEVFTGAEISKIDCVALLFCVASNGYYSLTKYQWTKDGLRLIVEIHPLLYTKTPGKFQCLIIAQAMKLRYSFEVLGSADQLYLARFLSSQSEEELEEIQETESPELQETASPVLQETKSVEEQRTESVDGQESEREEKQELELVKRNRQESDTEREQKTVDEQEQERDVVMRKDPDKLETESRSFQLKLKDICKSIQMIDCKEPNNLRLLDLIGEGSFGKVYRAVWRGSLVATKVVQLASKESKLFSEVDMYKKLQHPNIIQFMGLEMVNGRLAIIMALVDGPNLHNIIFSPEGEKIDYLKKTYLSMQLAQACFFIHSNVPPIAHLDIKPSNILVEQRSWRLFLEDFGLSQMMTETNAVGTKTMLAGIPGFQSPEQLRNESIGIATDIYAIGAVFLTLYGEKAVWPGLAPFQIMYQVAVREEKPNTSHLPPEVQNICDACLSRISDRPTAGQVLPQVMELFNI